MWRVQSVIVDECGSYSLLNSLRFVREENAVRPEWWIWSKQNSIMILERWRYGDNFSREGSFRMPWIISTRNSVSYNLKSCSNHPSISAGQTQRRFERSRRDRRFLCMASPSRLWSCAVYFSCCAVFFRSSEEVTRVRDFNFFHVELMEGYLRTGFVFVNLLSFLSDRNLWRQKWTSSLTFPTVRFGSYSLKCWRLQVLCFIVRQPLELSL